MSTSNPETESSDPEADAIPPLTEKVDTTSLPSGTEVIPDSPEDVLVLLPDGADGDVPVVETEAVEDEGSFPDSNTEIVESQDCPIEDVPLKSINPMTQEAGEEDEIPSEADAAGGLEELASEMEEDLFAGEAGAEEKPAPLPSRRAGAIEKPRAVPEFFPAGGQGSGRSRGRWKAAMAIAASLLLIAGGYLSFPHWRHLVEGELTAIASPGPAAGTAVPVDPTPAAGPVVSTVPAGADLVRASKEAFREKFLLTIELGYVGEVANE